MMGWRDIIHQLGAEVLQETPQGQPCRAAYLTTQGGLCCQSHLPHPSGLQPHLLAFRFFSRASRSFSRLIFLQH